MAYNVKYQLIFSDELGRPVKVEILKKNYQGAVQDMIGTGNPVTIQWDGDDDIYNPIIGSRCILELFVTDDVNYNEFWRYDEREFKLRVFRSTGMEGTTTWDNTPFVYDLADNDWDNQIDNNILFFEVIWEGFIVVDRFVESMQPRPYPIKVEAIDGLGTLDLFDSPINLTDSSVKEDLFYYIKEILLLTGHEHDIFIANNIRAYAGAFGADSSTVFHETDVNEFAFFTNKLVPRNAKEVLENILRITNSRIFHSYGRWYIISNSSVIDKRINELTEASSGNETFEDDEPVDPTTVIEAPNIEITLNGKRAGADNIIDHYNDTTAYFTVINTGGTIWQGTWSYTYDGNPTTLVQNFPAPFLIIILPSLHLTDDSTFSITCTNTLADGSTGTSTDSVVVNLIDPPSADPSNEGGEVSITVNNLVPNCVSSPLGVDIPFDASSVGTSFTTVFT